MLDWEICFEQLLEYKKANGNCNASQHHHSKNAKLGRWVRTQRRTKKTFQLSEEREAKLDSIGFVWNVCQM